MDLGVVVRPELEPETLVARVRAVEAADYAEVWLWEDCFWSGGIAAAATALAATDRITVGLGIMPAPVRNAAFAAMEIAGLARLHPGRFHAGLGHGVDGWMRQIGAKPASQLTLLEESLTAVRQLLAGETVSVEGRYVKLREVALGHPPDPVPLVSAGVRGPKSLALSGRAADGTVLDWFSTPAYVRWAREQIAATPHRLTVFALAITSPEEERVAREQLAGLTSAQREFVPEDPALDDVAVTPGGGFLAALEAAGADCVVLVPPDPARPLDLSALPAPA